MKTSRASIFAAAALCLAAASTVVCHRVRPAAAATTHGPQTSMNRFSLEIDGGGVPDILSVTGLESEGEATVLPDTKTRPGNQKPGRVTITRDFSGNQDWVAWRRAIATGKNDRRTVVVNALDPSMKIVARIALTGAWPSKWIGPTFNARSSESTTESLELVWDAIEIKKP